MSSAVNPAPMHPTPLKPARLPESLYAVGAYFLPRLMFLQSRHGAQIHWGDVAIALRDFPEHLRDLSSAEFWEEWMQRWSSLGEDYRQQAVASGTPAGRRRALRSAAACFHWAEFMYFADARHKTGLRRAVKDCFQRSLDHEAVSVSIGEFSYEGVPVPYYLALPQGRAAGAPPPPCVILSNGLDSVTELEVWAFAEQFLERGMAVFMFDGPGQGVNVGCNPIPAQFEKVAEHIVAKLEREPSIDATRLGFFGVSFGGYLALRVARHLGERFACVVNLSGGPQLAPYASMPRRLKEDFRFAFMGGDAHEMQTVFDSLALAPNGACGTDLLSVHGARDDIFPYAAVEQMDRQLGERHTLRSYPSEAHVCLNYINQYSIDIADWVAQRLLPRP